jgi:LacI family transcriptional regulator
MLYNIFIYDLINRLITYICRKFKKSLNMHRVSIKDIAQELGVSTAAVSLVLNGKEKGGRIGKVVAEKIRQKAREMNYEPNNLARGFRMGISNTIGLIVTDISNLFFANLAFHIQEEAEKFGYSVIITNTNESDLKMEKMINILKSRLVDGFIIVPTEHGKPYVQNLLKSNIPIVLIDRCIEGLNVSSVTVDNYEASKKAVKSLICRGCKNIGLIIYKSDAQNIVDRKRGYVDILKEFKLYNSSLIKEINYSFIANDIAIATESLLSNENRVDGIFYATNTLSMLGIKQLLDLNINISDDVKVVCFDKSEIFDFINVPIPYILQPISEMGKKSVDLLLEQVKQKSESVKTIELHTDLINNN